MPCFYPNSVLKGSQQPRSGSASYRPTKLWSLRAAHAMTFLPSVPPRRNPVGLDVEKRLFGHNSCCCVRTDEVPTLVDCTWSGPSSSAPCTVVRTIVAGTDPLYRAPHQLNRGIGQSPRGSVAPTNEKQFSENAIRSEATKGVLRNRRALANRSI